MHLGDDHKEKCLLLEKQNLLKTKNNLQPSQGTTSTLNAQRYSICRHACALSVQLYITPEPFVRAHAVTVVR